MIIAVDFDGTIVVQEGRAYKDVETPLEFIPGAKEALATLKQAGHTMLLWSARASRALLWNPEFDPLVAAGVKKLDWKAWKKSRPIHAARYMQMVEFVREQLPGVFDAIDDGFGGKPSVDLFIDDKALRLGYGTAAVDWMEIAHVYGQPTGEAEHE